MLEVDEVDETFYILSSINKISNIFRLKFLFFFTARLLQIFPENVNVEK